MLSTLGFIALAIGVVCYPAALFLLFSAQRIAKDYSKQTESDGDEEEPATEQDVAKFQRILRKAFIKPLILLFVGALFSFAGIVLLGFASLNGA